MTSPFPTTGFARRTLSGIRAVRGLCAMISQGVPANNGIAPGSRRGQQIQFLRGVADPCGIAAVRGQQPRATHRRTLSLRRVCCLPQLPGASVPGVF